MPNQIKDTINATAEALDVLTEEFDSWQDVDNTLADRIRVLQDQIAEINQQRTVLQDQLADRLDIKVPGWRSFVKLYNKRKKHKKQ